MENVWKDWKIGKSPIYQAMVRWFSPPWHLGAIWDAGRFPRWLPAPPLLLDPWSLKKSSECWSGFWIIVMIPASCWIIWWCSNNFGDLAGCLWVNDAAIWWWVDLLWRGTPQLSFRVEYHLPTQKLKSLLSRGVISAACLIFFRPTSAPDPNDPDNHTATWLHWSFLHPKSDLRFFKHICNAQTFRAKNHGFSQRVPFKPSIHL